MYAFRFVICFSNPNVTWNLYPILPSFELSWSCISDENSPVPMGFQIIFALSFIILSCYQWIFVNLSSPAFSLGSMPGRMGGQNISTLSKVEKNFFGLSMVHGRKANHSPAYAIKFREANRPPAWLVNKIQCPIIAKFIYHGLSWNCPIWLIMELTVPHYCQILFIGVIVVYHGNSVPHYC